MLPGAFAGDTMGGGAFASNCGARLSSPRLSLHAFPGRPLGSALLLQNCPGAMLASFRSIGVCAGSAALGGGGGGACACPRRGMASAAPKSSRLTRARRTRVHGPLVHREPAQPLAPRARAGADEERAARKPPPTQR